MKTKRRKTTIKIGNRYLTPLGIGSNSLDVHDCIAELVANCFDWSTARVDGSEVKIQVIFGDDYIQVRDNGAGMTEDELDIAINLAEAEDEIRERLGEARKGRYGMGLKIAALSLGWKFSIQTISHNNPLLEHSFEFNSRNLLNNDSTYLEDGLELVSSEKQQRSVLSDYSHGTSIIIEDLVEREFPSLNAIRDELQDRFLPDINNLSRTIGLRFEVIARNQGYADDSYKIENKDISRLFEDEVLKVDFANPSKWAMKKEYKYEGSDGKVYQLNGYLQLLAKRSVAEHKYGLNLYYQGQLIERFHKGKLLTTSGRAAEKTYGELHLDGCTPDPSKKKFLEDEAFMAIKGLIADDLQVYKKLTPATKDASLIIRREIDKRKGIHTSESNNTNTQSEGEGSSGTESGTGAGSGTGNGTSDENKNDFDSNLGAMPEGTIKVKDRLYIQITKEWVLEASLDPLRGVNWDSAYVKSPEHNDLRILKVYINPMSELFKTVKELYHVEKDQNKILEFYKKVAICECIYDKLREVHGFQPEYARELTDKVVYPQVLKLKNLR